MARKKNVVWKDGLFPFHCDAKVLNILLSTTRQTISVHRLTFSEKAVFTVYQMAYKVLQIHR